MCDSVAILRLYSCILHSHKNEYKVKDADIRTAIQNMKEVYKPNPGSLSDEIVYVVDYNDPGHRCAYLHKYAPFHTALVADMLGKALQQNPNLFNFINNSGRINICSLGGGPGTDIFGVLSVLNATYDLFQVSATVVDCMGKWKDMFHELVNELRFGNYGALGESVGEQYFDWKYLEHNLLSKMTNQVNQAIGRANLVTMIKFVSASSCKDTSAMIQRIFSAMKPGAIVLCIENAGGGFIGLIRKEAKNCNFKSVFHQNHENYSNSDLRIKEFGYESCFESRVSVCIWMKAYPKKIKCCQPIHSYGRQNNFPLSTVATHQPSRKHEDFIHNKTLTFYNRTHFSNTFDESFCKRIDIDHNKNFQEVPCTKGRKNTFFPSNAKVFKNSQGKISKPQRNKIPLKSEPQMNKNSMKSKPRRNINTVKASMVKSVQFEIDNLDFYQFHTNHEKNSDTVFNLKNIEAIQYTRYKSHESRMATNIRRNVSAEVSRPNFKYLGLTQVSSSASAPFRWMYSIRDAICQELIGIITENLFNMF